MAFTRSQATSLLTQAEMGLFDDSRANSLRGLGAGDLGKRIERARKARDRARDLLKRQKLASRAKTGSKRGASGDANQRSQRKAELLGDILVRFESQLKQIGLKQVEKRDTAKPPRKTAASKASKKPSAAKKTPASKAVSKQTAASKPAARKAAGGKTTAARIDTEKTPAPSRAGAKPSARTGGTATAGASGKGGAAKPSAARPGAKIQGKDKRASKPITPNRALANTRKLLEAKRARDRQGLPWQTLDPGHDHLPQPGYQSGQAAEKAEELHSGQSRMTQIEGSISTRDRKNQGKRDRHSGS